MCQKCTGSAGDKEEDLFTRLEFTQMRCPIASLLLLLQSGEHVLVDNGGNPVDPLLHLSYILQH